MLFSCTHRGGGGRWTGVCERVCKKITFIDSSKLMEFSTFSYGKLGSFIHFNAAFAESRVSELLSDKKKQEKHLYFFLFCFYYLVCFVCGAIKRATQTIDIVCREMKWNEIKCSAKEASQKWALKVRWSEIVETLVENMPSDSTHNSIIIIRLRTNDKDETIAIIFTFWCSQSLSPARGFFKN